MSDTLSKNTPSVFSVEKKSFNLKETPDFSNIRLKVTCNRCGEECSYVTLDQPCYYEAEKGKHQHIACKSCTPKNQCFCLFLDLSVDGISTAGDA